MVETGWFGSIASTSARSAEARRRGSRSLRTTTYKPGVGLWVSGSVRCRASAARPARRRERSPPRPPPSSSSRPAVPAQALADRILVRPGEAGEMLVDESDLHGLQVGVIKQPPPAGAGCEWRESNPPETTAFQRWWRRLAGLGVSAAFDREVAVGVPAAERQRVGLAPRRRRREATAPARAAGRRTTGWRPGRG